MDAFTIWFVGLFHGMNGLDLLALVSLFLLLALVLKAGGSRRVSRQPDRDQAHER